MFGGAPTLRRRRVPRARRRRSPHRYPGSRPHHRSRRCRGFAGHHFSGFLYREVRHVGRLYLGHFSLLLPEGSAWLRDSEEREHGAYRPRRLDERAYEIERAIEADLLVGEGEAVAAAGLRQRK